jgi:hypothetical protein
VLCSRTHVSARARRRFREGEGLSPREQQAFGDYVYHILAAVRDARDAQCAMPCHACF